MIYECDCENCGKHMRVQRGNREQPPRFCSRICKGESQRRQPLPFSREWLHQKYIVEGLGCPEIGKLIDRDASTVRLWLLEYGIPTRPRGHNRDQNLYLHGRPKGWKHSEETKRKVGEASRQRGAVPYLKDGKHHLAGKRGAAVPNWKGGVTPERQAFYSSVEWKAAVKAIWKRDNAKCRCCGLDSRTIHWRKRRFHIHHIVTFANRALRASIHNLVLLCDDCHYFVHSSANVNREFMGDYWRWNVRHTEPAL